MNKYDLIGASPFIIIIIFGLINLMIVEDYKYFLLTLIIMGLVLGGYYWGKYWERKSRDYKNKKSIGVN